MKMAMLAGSCFSGKVHLDYSVDYIRLCGLSVGESVVPLGCLNSSQGVGWGECKRVGKMGGGVLG